VIRSLVSQRSQIRHSDRKVAFRRDDPVGDLAALREDRAELAGGVGARPPVVSLDPVEHKRGGPLAARGGGPAAS